MLTAESIAMAAERATCKGQFASGECRPIAADPYRVAAEVYTQGLFESSYWWHVHAGQCLPRECDPSWRRVLGGGVTIVHNARTPWQFHRAPSWSDEYWDSLEGDSSEATTAAAWQAAKLLAGYRARCGGSPEGAFAGFATGGRCFHVQAHRRALAAQVVETKLRAFRGADP
jgi:hypothetical protein